MHRRLLAEEAVALGVRHIIRQRERIAELTRDGRDSQQAQKLLETLMALQKEHIAYRDQLLRELKS